LERLRQRHLQFGGDQLRQPVAVAVAQPHHAAHVAHHRFRAHGAEGDDLRDGTAPVFFADVFDDVRPAVIGKINVNIRRIDALGIQEPLEQQGVADRVHVRDFEQVGDDRTGGAAARHAGNALFAPVPDEIRDDEKVGDEARFINDRQFMLQPVNDRLDLGGDFRIGKGERFPLDRLEGRQPGGIVNARDDVFHPLGLGMDRVAAEQPLRELVAQVTFAREMFRRIEHRVMQFIERDFHVAFFRHFQGVLDRVRRFGKQRRHLLGAAQIKLLRHIARAHALGVAQQILRADANQAVVRVRIAFVDVMHVVGRDELQAGLFGELDQLPVDAGLLRHGVILQFEVIILRAHRLLEPLHRLPRLGNLILQNQRSESRRTGRRTAQSGLRGISPGLPCQCAACNNNPPDGREWRAG
jgi:hypothetical protein